MTRMLPVILALLVLPSLAFAVPSQLAHQGRLIDHDDVPLEDTHTMLFSLYDDLESGAVLWEELLEVEFSNGYYSVILGEDEDDNPLDTEVLGQYPVFLELAVDESDPLAPRHELVSVPYAIMADTCENVSGGIVDASEIRVGGDVVITEEGTWVGGSTEVSWDDLTDVPGGFADGIDDDTILSESEVEGYITDGPIDLAAGSTIAGVEVSAPLTRETFRVHKGGVDQGGILTGALNRVTWPTEAFDTGGGFADDRFTSPTGGKYAFHAAVMFNELVHYDNMIALYKNGSMIAMENYFIAVDGTNSGRPTMTVSTILHLDPGDYVDVWVHQESSDTLSVQGVEYATYFTGQRVDL